jgi:hypothetical protein
MIRYHIIHKLGHFHIIKGAPDSVAQYLIQPDIDRNQIIILKVGRKTRIVDIPVTADENTIIELLETS